MKIHQRPLPLVTFILLFLSACQARATLVPTTTQAKLAATITASSTSSPGPTRTWTPRLTATTTTHATESTAVQDPTGVAAAQEALETYCRPLEEKQYTEAYFLLSDARPHPNSLEEFVASQEQLLESFELLTVQHYPESVSTLAATGAYVRTTWPTYESDHCKIFVTTTDVQYVGGWGAEPSGNDISFVAVKKEEDGWRLVSITSGIGRDACQ